MRYQNLKYVLSYGGGVNSTALMIHLVENKMPVDYIVFSYTGKGGELPETIGYLEWMKWYAREHNIKVKFVSNKKESLFERLFRRRIIASTVWRFCTRDFKVAPIHTFYRSLNCHIMEYMGIDYDEVWRMKDSKDDYITKLYPLIDNKITRDKCIEIIQNAGMPIPIKSGCPFCPFNNKERWDYIKTNHPAIFKKAQELEVNNKHYPKQKLIVLSDKEMMCDEVCMT